MTELATHHAPPKQSAMVALATRCQVEPAKLTAALKETVFKNATDSELMALCVVANEYGLNPFTKELYAFPAKGGGIVPIVSIDGWLNIINSHPQFDGMTPEVSADGSECTVTIHRKDRSHPTVVTEYLDECQGTSGPWNSHPKRMLRHKAIIQAARIAFGFSGIHDEDEGRVIAADDPRDARPVVDVKSEPIDPFAEAQKAQTTTEAAAKKPEEEEAPAMEEIA